MRNISDLTAMSLRAAPQPQQPNETDIADMENVAFLMSGLAIQYPHSNFVRLVSDKRNLTVWATAFRQKNIAKEDIRQFLRWVAGSAIKHQEISLGFVIESIRGDQATRAQRELMQEGREKLKALPKRPDRATAEGFIDKMRAALNGRSPQQT